MTSATWFIELEATTAETITEEVIDQVIEELAGTAPITSHTEHSFRVHLSVEVTPNGFFTAGEAAITHAVHLVSTAAGVAGITPITFTEMKASASPAEENEAAA